METEPEKARRIFKFWKAAGKFPNKVSELEGWRLLNKYNYTIAKNIDKKEVNALTELVNILDRDRIVIVFGDFELETLMFGLRSYRNNPSGTNVITIDATSNRLDSLSYSMTATQSGVQTIYVIDNAESLRDSEVKQLLWIKENSDKPVVCCYQNISKIPKALKACKKIKLGDVTDESTRWRTLLQKLFNGKDRNEVLDMLGRSVDKKMPLSYLLRLAGFNAPQFYQDNYSTILTIEEAGRHLYRCPENLLLGYVAFGIRPTSNRRVVRFPPAESIKKKGEKKDGKRSEKGRRERGKRDEEV